MTSVRAREGSPPADAHVPTARAHLADRRSRLDRLDLLIALGFVALAAALRVGPLGPPSLWVDDAWVTLVIKTHGLSQFRLVAQTAPGFAGLLKGWLAVVGFSETKAQLVPFAFGVATAAGAYVAFATLGLARLAAAAGALFLVVSPIHVTQSTHVKQFTLDCLCSLVVLVLSVRLLEDVRSPRRWWTLAVGGTVALVLSGPSSAFLAAGLGVALIRLWRENRAALSVAYGPIVVAGAATLTWWALVLRTANSDTLRKFWAGYFLTFDEGPRKAVLRAGRMGRDFFEAALPITPYVGALLVIVAFALVFRRDRYLGLLLIAPPAIAVALAALKYAPLGTGRTDLYLYPALAFAIAVAVDHLHAARSRVGVGLVLAVAAWALLATAFADHAYPKEDVASLVAEAEAVVPPSEAILVYHDTNFAFALYTTWPIEFERTDAQPMAFEAPVQRSNVFTLVPHDQHPSAYAPTIDRMLRSYRVVWLVASHTTYRPGDFAALERLLRDRRLKPGRAYRWSGASLTRWSPS